MNAPYSHQRPPGQPASYAYPPRRMSGARIAWITWCFGWAFIWGLGGLIFFATIIGAIAGLFMAVTSGLAALLPIGKAPRRQ
jgi:hypothetical protein